MQSACCINDSNLAYYINSYFFANPHMPGYWFGKGAAMLGLHGVVTQQPHESLLMGFAPDGSKLIRNAGQREVSYGLDLPVSYPKSVSVQIPWFSRNQFETFCGIDHSVTALVVETWEDRVAIVRRGKEGVERHRAGMVVGGYLQFDSRAGDIHAHKHHVVMRPACTKDGHWGALDQKEFFGRGVKMALGALARAECAFLLEREMGMIPVRKGFSFEIDKVRDEVIRQSSTRRQQVEKSLAESGHSSARAAAIATMSSRDAKEHVPLPELMNEWRHRLKEMGFGPEESAKCQNRQRTHAEPLEVREKQALDIAIARVTEQRSHFTDMDLIRYVAEEAQGRGISGRQVLTTVDTALEQSPEIIKLGNLENRPVYTTREVMAIEKAFLQDALIAQIDTKHTIDSMKVKQSLDQKKHLSDDQRNAITHITARPGAVQAVIGLPGTGKTTLVREATEIFTKEGFGVRSAANSGKAAVGLEAEAGIPSDTIARILLTLRDEREGQTINGKPIKSGIDANTIFIVDEAAMAGTRQLNELQSELLSRGAKIIYIGDPRQLQSIEFGGGLSSLATRIGYAELTDIRRQTEPWARKAVTQFGKGEAHEALHAHAEHGQVKVTKTRHEAMQSMIDDFREIGIKSPQDIIMLTSTRNEAHRLCQAAQADRLAAQAISERYLSVGDIRIHLNDRIMCLKNQRSLGVRNGQLGTVVNVDHMQQTLKVRIDKGPTVLLPVDDYPHLALSYAITTYKSQSMTIPTCLALVSETPDRETTLVQASRSREKTKFYIDRITAGKDLADVVKAMSRSHPQVMAHDIAQQNATSPAKTAPSPVIRPEFQP